MFRIKDHEIKQLEDDLDKFAAKALPFATRSTLNTAAFQTQKLARTDVTVKMIERNRFTKQSIQVDQARTLAIPRQAATIGSIAGYMEDQEFGAIKVKRGSEGVAIPTSYASGQGQNIQPRTRLPRRPNRLQNIQLSKRRSKGSNRKQRMVLTIRDAVDTGNRIVFLDLGRRQGIFKVVGGKKGTKRGWPNGANIKMLYDLTNESVVIPKNPWLKPAFDTVIHRIPVIYRKAVTFQLKRLQLFRG